ncbi:MAG: hypothetical protein A3G52_00540 [Candidatus Taylorbacteria bacterium RIFCSPLOWO2_12_FULL_43_20]|uniref:Uncharacterized protein n=1 Tax=Candidatus Taylorbacteria bacterium RIFCSPLOWO2_12_FULL_43_20 TaxID=1802332 RepID=A0A1G2P2S3_9BACT|nr:MAG: hypothetical protein A3B98_04535 [Candidatus Taylorbacteria bacterium RIFCSPHIGHO2_02_FULL_43_55]OHA29983.1 MAG: hypothetical protein A3E92_02815 [Candidatus Taylorbacteria bacterium RIFCSPHIGHO2_12_FULL_42_34]OHA31697.1 MAG: hypothetical protein A3B09_00845 [Candidatus Taylorbacteria bacterium RIFCSPLOWO2_01_FULL_43_83]OHA42648.1 MAG: hypothetical protein A3G52_00540 [Candidatus Taylorbacteria bacterium RIFCSPLOWO2_12_FULL_43_20]
MWSENLFGAGNQQGRSKKEKECMYQKEREYLSLLLKESQEWKRNRPEGWEDESKCPGWQEELFRRTEIHRITHPPPQPVGTLADLGRFCGH